MSKCNQQMKFYFTTEELRQLAYFFRKLDSLYPLMISKSRYIDLYKLRIKVDDYLDFNS